jgi:predicted nuclease of predicted toxin-antitoxin system
VRVLIDENLSERLLPPLGDLISELLHVRTLGLAGASDARVWELARQRQCDPLLTTDGDFVGHSLMHGAPPKVVYLARQDARTATVAARIRAGIGVIRLLVASDEVTYVVLP